MRIKRIKINNFKSIASLDLDMTAFDGLWEVHGVIGSGKTTLSESILFALFGKIKSKTNKDFVTWGESSGCVELWCDVRRGSLYIRRSMTRTASTLYLELNGQPVTFTDKRDAQSILEESYYDISRQAVEQLCIISFNNFHSLATMTTAERKRFIDNIFSLDVLTQYCDIIAREKSVLNTQIAKLQTVIDTHTKTIAMNESKLRDVERLSVSVDVPALEAEIARLDATCERLTFLRGRHEERYGRIEIGLITRQSQITQSGKDVSSRIELARSGVCPTCHRPVDGTNLAQYEVERDALRAEYKSVDAVIRRVRSLRKARIDAYVEELRSATTKRNADASQITSHKKSIATQTTTLNEQIEYCRREIENVEREKNALRVSYNEYDELSSIINITIRQNALGHIVPTLNENIAYYTSKLSQPFFITFDESFNCNVTTYNNATVNINALSTGQLKIVDMIIILATIRTIISGVNFNVYFLDELLANLDKDLRDAVCRVLRDECVGGKSIFVISHAGLDEEFFDGVVSCDVTMHHDTMLSTYTIKSNRAV